jgi:hypothetical protein
MQFKDTTPIHIDEDFWYALTDGGYINPFKILVDSDAHEVMLAIKTLKQFETELYNMGILEEC